LQISYQLTVDDYRQAFKAFRKRTPFSRWVYFLVTPLFVLVAASALLLTFFGPDRSFHNLFPLWAIVAFWAWYIWCCRYRVANRMMKGNPSALLPHTMDVSESGIFSRTSASETRFTWDIIVGWAEVERVFVLFLSPVSFFPIPKRAISSDQQNELRTLLQSKAGKLNDRSERGF
jgi:hypothetical protein